MNSELNLFKVKQDLQGQNKTTLLLSKTGLYFLETIGIAYQIINVIIILSFHITKVIY